MEAKLSEAITASDLSNAAAVSTASVHYNASMQRALRSGALSAARLQSEHERAAAAANDEFAKKRNRASDHPRSDDHFLNELLRVRLILVQVPAPSNRRKSTTRYRPPS